MKMTQSPLAILRSAQDQLRSVIRDRTIPEIVCQSVEAADVRLATAIHLLADDYAKKYGGKP